MYEYKAKVHRVLDGDTVDVVIDLGFEMSSRQRLRLYGIDTPEVRTRDLKEKARGKAAKSRLLQLINDCKREVIVQTLKRGKYGRFLAKILNPDTRENFNQTLLKEGHAKRMVF